MMQATASATLADPMAARQAGREWLSLALMDARNHLLSRLAQDESAPTLRRAARAGWFQEQWINGHVQRQRGEACDASAPRLAGIEPAITTWLEPDAEPAAQSVRGYLQDTLETALDLLAGAEETDAGLYFFRLALQHEDRQCETLALAAGKGLAPARPQRPPLWLPAQRWQLGSPRGGLVPWAERWAHEVAVPEFEIDAQPVNWSQFVEFAEDGGYDRTELWGTAGWAWLQAQAEQGRARRAPRDVEQLRGGVLVQRRQGGKLVLQRAAAGQPVTQVSRFEAQAWCAWAGRRLPTEPEWELAACSAASRGFAWGDVLEWVAGSARAWPDAGPVPPGSLEAGLGEQLDGLQVPPGADSQAAALGQVAVPHSSGVLRGATYAARARWRHPKARRFALASDDTGPKGFRSCAL
jgi:hypothetical protein